MKRAWPYALALAVVVTGCYLALAPLLRSLTPGPTGTQAVTLVSSRTTTVPATNASPAVVLKSNDPGFTSQVKVAVKKTTKKSSKKTANVVQTPVFVSPPATTSNSSPSTTSSSTTTTTTPSSKPKSTGKTASTNSTRLPRSVGGGIDQADNGGFAGQGNGDSAVTGGKSSTVANGG